MGKNFNRATVLCIINHKGGVGKTVTTSTLAGILADLGYKVLIIDNDHQGNTSQLYDLYYNTSRSITDIFSMNANSRTYEAVCNCIYHTSLENVDLIPSNDDFALAIDDVSNDRSRIIQYILRDTINLIEKDYDYIVIDNGPWYNISTINALAASDYVITPTESDAFGYNGLISLLKKINTIKSELNPAMEFKGVFLTKFNSSNGDHRKTYEFYEDNVSAFIPKFISQDSKACRCTTELELPSKLCPKAKFVWDYKTLLLFLNILPPDTQNKLSQEVSLHLTRSEYDGKSITKRFNTETNNKIADALGF